MKTDTQPQVTFLPGEADGDRAQPTWWHRRSRPQKGAVFGATALLVFYGIGTVTGSPSDAPTAAGASATPASATATASPTEDPTSEPTAALGTAPIGQTSVGQVVDVVDGDTIKVEIDGEVFTVRYIGIDTPETVDPSSPVEWMGPEASAANATLVDGQEVVLEKDVSEVDRYDRLLRYVWLQRGTGWLLINAELVRLGFANASSYPPDVLYQELFRAAETDARDADRGLWGPVPTPTPAPTPPPTPVPSVAPPPPPPPPPPTAQPANCHPSYAGACLLIGQGDYDCAGGSGNGPNYVAGPIQVVGPDEFDLDRDGDGIACEG